MVLSTQLMERINFISKKDADFRYEEYLKYKNLNPNPENYPFDKMNEIWPEGKFFNFKNVDGWYGELEGKMVIVFRGSDSLIDWIKNFVFIKKDIPYKEKGTNKKIRVHRGFYTSYLLARDFIHEIVRNTDKEIVFHGHSKGAALSALAALDIQYNFNKDVGIFAAGCPKIGNKYFKQSFEKRIPDMVRYTYSNDMVASAPPSIFMYHHIGKEIHYGSERKWYKLNMKDHNWNNYYELFLELTKEK